jgi:hypothetical protein
MNKEEHDEAVAYATKFLNDFDIENDLRDNIIGPFIRSYRDWVVKETRLDHSRLDMISAPLVPTMSYHSIVIRIAQCCPSPKCNYSFSSTISCKF